ncbi:RidA family protein [Micromonospora sp. DT178]|uniref:RidA family protein n=1 Tax=Micromonospora reichwaldensis TaxID=3075516 RepID=A0ABU2WSG0_9ACTN|nr:MULTISPECIES: RidA family protein [unclassified Micromonospora]KAB1147381.1 RidA family protein [Micromonospora sp. AMSO12t]MDT0528311.1 RidA family protein [Micromonospora sp. DSM 115977]WSG04082.1 RidA family protein [Micromonospora sp. NBC_01740]
MIETMQMRPINPESVPEATGGYHNALEVQTAGRMLFISGQIPQSRDGHVPATPEAQCRLVWDNIRAVLADAGMDVDNLVKVTTFLADRRHADVNTKVRNEVLGAHRPALTVIVTGIFDPEWIIEIEAIAVA